MKIDSPDVFVYERFKVNEATGELWGYFTDDDGEENCEPIATTRITDIVREMLDVVGWLYQYQLKQEQGVKWGPDKLVDAKYRTREDAGC